MAYYTQSPTPTGSYPTYQPAQTNVIVMNQYGQVIGGNTVGAGVAAQAGPEDEKKKKREKIVKGTFSP